MVFRFEAKRYLRSALLWSFNGIALYFIFMAFFPIIAKDASMMDTIVEHYPEELLKAFGMSNQVSLSSVLGYFSFCYTFVQLCMAIQGANYGFHCLSVEERELTADFLMAKPVKRHTIFMSKYTAVLLGVMVTQIFLYIGAIASIEVFRAEKSYDLKLVNMMLFAGPLFQLVFVNVGLIISLLVKKVRSVLSFSMALVFSMYIINAIRGIIDSQWLGIMTPFYHFDALYIIENEHYNTPFFGLSLAVLIVSFVASYWMYLKRDIHSL